MTVICIYTCNQRSCHENFPRKLKSSFKKKNKNKTLDHKKEPSWAHQPRPQSTILFYISMWGSSSLMPQAVTTNLACEEWFPIMIGALRFQPVFLSSLFSSVLKNHISHFIFATRTWSHTTAVSKLQLLYSGLFFLDVLLQRSWPSADTWSILRVAPLNVNSFYLPLVERQHSEVEVAYNIKENPLGSGILLSRVSRGIWSEELTVLHTHTHTHTHTHRVQLSHSCFTAYPDLLE